MSHQPNRSTVSGANERAMFSSAHQGSRRHERASGTARGTRHERSPRRLLRLAALAVVLAAAWLPAAAVDGDRVEEVL